MARIDRVDYEAMPGQAKRMREYALELNDELKTAYLKVGEMHNAWYGVRYNELVKDFNELTESINELLELVVTTIPFKLETVANNYSNSDQTHGVVSAEETPANKIENIAITNDVGMRFITEDVENTQRAISEEFNKAKNLMDTIKAEYDKVDWESEASEKFKKKIVELSENIKAAFDNINTQFVKLMTQTQEDIENTEKANTVE